MALDQALLQRADQTGEGWVRLYRWKPWCLSFGRNEPALRRYDRDAIARLGLDTVRRPTGGRAVWHARELTYAVAAPVAWFGGLAESYHRIHATLADALRGLGIAVTLAPPGATPGIGAGACFSSPVGGEVLAGGRKLLGSAQLRQGSAFLQHGSLLLEDRQELLRELTIGPAAPGGEITLSEAAGRAIGFEEAASAIAGTLATWPGNWHGDERALDPELLAQAEGPRFRDAAWTWRR
jgi:lipoate-protein ligase A